jgi:hypothetical protein
MLAGCGKVLTLRYLEVTVMPVVKEQNKLKQNKLNNNSNNKKKKKKVKVKQSYSHNRLWRRIGL